MSIGRVDLLPCNDLGEALRALVVALKKTGHRGLIELAEAAGLKSAASMSMILKGTRRLTLQSATRITENLKLDRRSARLFLLFAKRALTSQSDERMKIDEQIFFLKRRRDSAEMELSQYRFLSVWYYPVIYALAANALPYCAEEIARRLGRGTTEAMVRSGVGDLINLGLLKFENGVLTQIRGPITTSERVRSMAIRRYHREMLRLASESVELPPEERELNGLTVMVPKENLQAVKDRIREFREDMTHLLTGVTNGEVHQLSIQFFPLTQSTESRGNHDN